MMKKLSSFINDSIIDYTDESTVGAAFLPDIKNEDFSNFLGNSYKEGELVVREVTLPLALFMLTTICDECSLTKHICEIRRSLVNSMRTRASQNFSESKVLLSLGDLICYFVERKRVMPSVYEQVP